MDGDKPPRKEKGRPKVDQSLSSSGSSASSLLNIVTTGIKHPGRNDVMFGRGGDTNYHVGNHRFRTMADSYRESYRQASRKEKTVIVQQLVDSWRAEDPPGRFLTRTDPSKGDASLWHDVGTEMALKKAAKILTERASTTQKGSKKRQAKASIPSSDNEARTSRQRREEQNQGIPQQQQGLPQHQQGSYPAPFASYPPYLPAASMGPGQFQRQQNPALHSITQAQFQLQQNTSIRTGISQASFSQMPAGVTLPAHQQNPLGFAVPPPFMMSGNPPNQGMHHVSMINQLLFAANNAPTAVNPTQQAGASVPMGTPVQPQGASATLPFLVGASGAPTQGASAQGASAGRAQPEGQSKEDSPPIEVGAASAIPSAASLSGVFNSSSSENKPTGDSPSTDES